MKKLVKYAGQVFMSPSGQLFTPDRMSQEFPSIQYFSHVIETDENCEVCFAVMNLSALRSLHNIDVSLSESEAILALQSEMNKEPEMVISSEERIAAALEFQNLMSMSDVTE